MTSIAIASGKGGTGKSVFSASLASAFAGRGLPTILFDADLGVEVVVDDTRPQIIQSPASGCTGAH